MLKRYFKSETYRKMGSPDLETKIYFMKNNKKIYGKIALIQFTSEKSKHNGDILIGLEPFKNKNDVNR